MLLLRFLPGILVLEMATAALVYVLVAPGTPPAFWVPALVLGGAVTLLTAFWFGSIADHVKKDAVRRAGVRHAQDREGLVVAAEIDKRAALEQNHQRLLKAAARAQAQANWRLGLGLTGLLTLGGMLLAIEFMTVGLLVMALAGGALGGYVLRARQVPRSLARGTAPPWLAGRVVKTIETPSAAERKTSHP